MKRSKAAVAIDIWPVERGNKCCIDQSDASYPVLGPFGLLPPPHPTKRLPKLIYWAISYKIQLWLTSDESIQRPLLKDYSPNPNEAVTVKCWNLVGKGNILGLK